MILSSSGYRVETLNSGEMALQAIKNFSPHLILMDVMLGTMDGRLICRKLKQSDQTCSLLLIPTSASHNLSLSLQQQGAPNDFIAKPFEHKLSKNYHNENLINTHLDAFRAVFLFGKFDNVQARRVFVPIALFMTTAILVFDHIPKF